MSHAEAVDETVAALREVGAEHSCEVGRSGSYDVIVVGGTGEDIHPIPQAVFRRAHELGLEAAGADVGDPTGRPQVGFNFAEPPERSED